MIEKPDINDEAIISALKENYSLSVNSIHFLPVGNDASAWAYRIVTDFEDAYFLKIRKLFNPPGLFIPRFLKDSGIEQVVAPLVTKNQELAVKIGEFVLILYPFIAGNEAIEVGMTNAQWIEFGSTLKQVHSLNIESVPPSKPELERETFIPKWSDIAANVQERVNSQVYENAYQRELAKCWKEHQTLIRDIFEQTDKLGKLLRSASPEFVICHADIHTANILVTQEQSIFIIDWDGALLAPKERDLMFVVGDDVVEASEAELFFKGYGDVDINLLALAYYKYEWCVQEIGDYGERVFGADNIGKDTKKAAVEEFIKLFSRGNVIEIALHTPTEANGK
jgi:spectinomycin phosphotransferase